MGEHDELIQVLNQAVSHEYTGAIQYSQHSMLVTGEDKALFEEFFEDGAEEGMAHAKLWGEKIVWLGGAPSAEVGTISQSTDAREMLKFDLEHEKKAVEVYTHALDVCDHEPTQYLLEDHIIEEQEDVEEVQKLLGQVSIAEGTTEVEKEVV